MDYLIDQNRTSLRAIFLMHSCERQMITYNEFIKFCQTVRIYPDLVSSFELKRLVMKIANSNTYIDRKVEINYIQFERLIVLISEHCFSSSSVSEKLELLFKHIKNPVKHYYHIDLNVIAENQ